MWILSSYGPGRDAPLQLFGGYPREQSFEELRLHHYVLAAAGNQGQAIQEAQQLFTNAEQQIQSALNDVDGAIKYIVGGRDQHPNRIDICKARGSISSQGNVPSPMQSSTSTMHQAQSSTFGQPSLPAQTSGTFGKPSTPFGQASSLGNHLNPFADAGSFFGQPSGPNPFTKALATTFGQASQQMPFGQQSTGGFGQPSAPRSGPFGQPSAAQPSPFSQQAQPQPTAFGAALAPSNPFARPPTQTQPISTPFGQATPAQSTPFGAAPTPFINPVNRGSASTQATTFAFGQPQPQPQSTSEFGRPATQPQQGSGFGQAPAQSPPKTAPTASVPSSGPTRKDSRGQLTVWHGKPITYVDGEPCFKRPDGLWEKVWFPDAVPSWKKEITVPEGWWTDEVKGVYERARAAGGFEGLMPDVMPKREWVSWDF